MEGAQVAVSPYKPADWPDHTVLLIRRLKLDPDQVSAGPAPGRAAAAPCTPISGPCSSRNWSSSRPSTPPASSAPTSTCPPPCQGGRAAEHYWYRHRTSVENIFRDSKHGAALRHLPSGHEQVNTAWMWASLIAAAVAAWLHQLTGLIDGGELLEGHGVRGGKAMIATLRRALIAVPARPVRHGGQLITRLAPGPCLLPGILAAIRALPAPG